MLAMVSFEMTRICAMPRRSPFISVIWSLRVKVVPFVVASFFGALLAMLLEPITQQLLIAGVLMAVGVNLYAITRMHTNTSMTL